MNDYYEITTQDIILLDENANKQAEIEAQNRIRIIKQKEQKEQNDQKEKIKDDKSNINTNHIEQVVVNNNDKGMNITNDVVKKTDQNQPTIVPKGTKSKPSDFRSSILRSSLLKGMPSERNKTSLKKSTTSKPSTSRRSNHKSTTHSTNSTSRRTVSHNGATTNNSRKSNGGTREHKKNITKVQTIKIIEDPEDLQSRVDDPIDAIEVDQQETDCFQTERKILKRTSKELDDERQIDDEVEVKKRKTDSTTTETTTNAITNIFCTQDIQFFIDELDKDLPDEHEEKPLVEEDKPNKKSDIEEWMDLDEIIEDTIVSEGGNVFAKTNDTMKIDGCKNTEDESEIQILKSIKRKMKEKGDVYSLGNPIYGIPSGIVESYAECGVTSLYPWQVECLHLDGVLTSERNLVYTAPTSGGKTLVAEILMIRMLSIGLKKNKKVTESSFN